jgi:hypothetical protein
LTTEKPPCDRLLVPFTRLRLIAILLSAAAVPLLRFA